MDRCLNFYRKGSFSCVDLYDANDKSLVSARVYKLNSKHSIGTDSTECKGA